MKVSVIIPAYNHEKYVKDSIMSVINQTYNNYELIVINDGSTDNTAEVINQLQVLYGFRFIDKKNEGLSKTLQMSLNYISGDFITFLASDDVWLPNKLSVQVDYMNSHPSTVACCALVNVIDGNCNVYHKNPGKHIECFDFEKIMMAGYGIPPATLLMRSRLLQPSYFKENFNVEDLFLWLSLTRNGGTIDVLPEILANYRIHDKNTTNNLALIAHGHRQCINEFSNTTIYKKAKVSWSKFSYRQLSRNFKKEAFKYILFDVGFLFSKEFLIGTFKLIFVWK